MHSQIHTTLKTLHQQGFLVRVPLESKPSVRHGYLTILQVIAPKYIVTGSYSEIPTDVCPLWVARSVETLNYWQNQEEFDAFAGEFIKSFPNWEQLGALGWERVFEQFWDFLDTPFVKTTNPNRVASCLLAAKTSGKTLQSIYQALFESIKREATSVQPI